MVQRQLSLGEKGRVRIFFPFLSFPLPVFIAHAHFSCDRRLLPKQECRKISAL